MKNSTVGIKEPEYFNGKVMAHSIAKPSEIKSEGEAYVVISSTTIYIEGDERSRLNPGHGYPAENMIVPVIHVFYDLPMLLNWLEQQNPDFECRIISGNIQNMTREVKVSVKLTPTQNEPFDMYAKEFPRFDLTTEKLRNYNK